MIYPPSPILIIKAPTVWVFGGFVNFRQDRENQGTSNGMGIQPVFRVLGLQVLHGAVGFRFKG